MARKKARPAQIKIRLPETLRRDLEREAAKAGRTLNGEIVYRLTQPFVQADLETAAKKGAEQAIGRWVSAEGFSIEDVRAVDPTYKHRIKGKKDNGETS